MVEITVCVGSSCHMKGSYQVIQIFTDLIKKNKLDSEISLKASFCMGRCLSGIAVTANGAPIENVGFVNAEQIFYEKIYPLVHPEFEGGNML